LRAEHAPSDSKQPRQSIRRRLSESSPADQENVRDHIVGDRRVGATQDICLDEGSVPTIHRLKLGAPVHILVMAGHPDSVTPRMLLLWPATAPDLHSAPYAPGKCASDIACSGGSQWGGLSFSGRASRPRGLPSGLSGALSGAPLRGTSLFRHSSPEVPRTGPTTNNRGASTPISTSGSRRLKRPTAQRSTLRPFP
jgi:hypothetical protein